MICGNVVVYRTSHLVDNFSSYVLLVIVLRTAYNQPDYISMQDVRPSTSTLVPNFNKNTDTFSIKLCYKV